MTLRPCQLARRFALCVCTAVLAAHASTAAAQDGSSTPPAVSVAELQTRLGQLETELSREREAAEARAAAQQAQVEELTARRSELAEQLLSVELEREQLAARQRRLESQQSTIEAEAKQLQDQLRAALAAAAGSAEKLSIYLRELPGSDEQRANVTRTINGLAPAGAARVTQAQRAAATALLSQLQNTLTDASHTSLRETEIWTAADRREQVRLLSAGHVAFAYQTIDDGRFGIALASPADAAGFRWTEELDGTARAQLAQAFDDVAAGADSFDMLIDVSGRIGPSNLQQQDTMAGRLREGGPVMWPLAFVALLALVLIIERSWVLYGRNAGSGAMARRVIDLCRQGRFDEALDQCRSRRGAVARTLAAALERRTKGQQAMEDSIQAQLLNELPPLQRFMGGIAILAGVAPLLGLLGTVTGIIHTFGVIRAFGNANPSMMAGGISEALLTTAAGLVIAVPILLVHSLLSGRVDRIVGNAEKHAANLLAVLAHDVDAAPDEVETDAAEHSHVTEAASRE